MKLQPATQKEVRRIALGTAICAAVMVAVFALLGSFHLIQFGLPVVLGAIGGSIVAVLNFTLMCLTVQAAAGITDPKQLHARVQASYNGRLLLQALWAVAGLVAPCFQPVAALLPLLFPRVVIFYLQATGKYKPEPAPEATETADPADNASAEETKEETNQKDSESETEQER